jgi:hypothetical protein
MLHHVVIHLDAADHLKVVRRKERRSKVLSKSFRNTASVTAIHIGWRSRTPPIIAALQLVTGTSEAVSANDVATWQEERYRLSCTIHIEPIIITHRALCIGGAGEIGNAGKFSSGMRTIRLSIDMLTINTSRLCV